MRKLIVLPLIVAGAFAGTTALSSDSAKEPISEAKSAKKSIVPTPTPNLHQWFAGGTAGYLLDSECEFFSGHVGKDLAYQLGGWDTAVYLEVGYFDCDHHESFDDKKFDFKYDKKDDYQYDQSYGTSPQRSIWYDYDAIPVSLNYKLERDLTDKLSVYAGVGAGVAFFDLDSSTGDSDSDTTFFAQAFAGLLYNISESFEVYAGGRLLYFDDPSFNIDGTTVELDDLGADELDGLVEIGARYNF